MIFRILFDANIKILSSKSSEIKIKNIQELF